MDTYVDLSNLALACKQRELTPYQKLYITMIALLIQDLSLENSFKELKPWYLISKKKKSNVVDINSAMEYLTDTELEHPTSFINCCEQLRLNPENLRKRILGFIPQSCVYSQIKKWYETR